MKTILDYIEENIRFKGEIGQASIKIERFEDIIILTRDNHVHTFKIDDDYKPELKIQDILEKHGIEIRFCEHCGKPYDAGYTVDGGFWYCCEDCFEEVMNKDYGEGNWRATEEMGENDGYYEFLNTDCVWEDTGIYYTEWN